MADHAAGKQDIGVGRDLEEDISYAPPQKQQAGQKDRNRKSEMENSPGVPPWLVETNYKREQIQAERQNPEKRYDGHILTDLVGRGQKHDGSARRQAQPKQMASPG